MDDDHDDDLPPVSRISRGGTRRYRILSRPRVLRQRKQRPVAELIGMVVQQHKLTDEMRQRFVCLCWPEIVGERISSKTFPASLKDGVLHVSAITSSWVQEMQFAKAKLVAQINSWVDANRVWLGAGPLVTDIRFALGNPRREWLVDPDYARRLRERQLRRTRPRIARVAPVASDADREAIQVETSTIVDEDLRAVIEAVRTKWNL